MHLIKAIVVVILSDKFLRSPHCMRELYGIWVESRGRTNEFLSRIRMVKLSDAAIWSLAQRGAYIDHWSEELAKGEALFETYGLRLALDEIEDLRPMREFEHHVSTLLRRITDSLFCCGVDEVEKQTF
ncbi:MAG: hypothetical protein AAF732_22940 [Pseudomonadota bacterium]